MSRIIAGQFGGRRIHIPPQGTRPTTDRVREALFNILESRLDFEYLRVLDLYAGSGALGIEALSRGAASAIFVDSSRSACMTVKKNITQLGVIQAKIYHGKVATVLNQHQPVCADLIFMDPPYELDTSEIVRVISLLTTHNWVCAETVLVIERSCSSPIVTWPDQWIPWSPRHYGSTRLDIAHHG